MDKFFETIDRNAFYAVIAIFVIAIIYTISPKIGILVAVTIAFAAIANMYAAGIIKPAKG